MSYSVPAHGLWWLPQRSIGTFPYRDTTIPAGWVNPGAAAWPTTNLIIYSPIRVKGRVVVRKLWTDANATASGNADVGIYDAAGTRLVSSGATAQAGYLQVYDVADTTIGPGLYYIAVTADNTTGQFLRYDLSPPLQTAMGVLTEAGSGSLPTTATWEQNQTAHYVPFAGMLFETSVT